MWVKNGGMFMINIVRWRSGVRRVRRDRDRIRMSSEEAKERDWEGSRSIEVFGFGIDSLGGLQELGWVTIASRAEGAKVLDSLGLYTKGLIGEDPALLDEQTSGGPLGCKTDFVGGCL
ncbi:hypothetical protein SLA2020_311280 [Shorea laevis]